MRPGFLLPEETISVQVKEAMTLTATERDLVDAASRWFDAHRAQFVDELCELLRYPSVTEVAVYPIPDPAVGDRVMAAMVLAEGADAEALGGVVAAGEEVDAGLARDVHDPLGDLAGEVGVEPGGDRLVDLALGAARDDADRRDPLGSVEEGERLLTEQLAAALGARQLVSLRTVDAAELGAHVGAQIAEFSPTDLVVDTFPEGVRCSSG